MSKPWEKKADTLWPDCPVCGSETETETCNGDWHWNDKERYDFTYFDHKCVKCGFKFMTEVKSVPVIHLVEAGDANPEAWKLKCKYKGVL